MIPLVIAIDGPGASGKSTVGKLVAQHLGYRFIDTGAMYRALTWVALNRKISFEDEAALAHLAATTTLEVQPMTPQAPEGQVLVQGEDISPHLHAPEVDAKVSLLARVSQVRSVLVAAQRRLAEEGQLVMAGRDIGSVVLPDATLKVFLDASVEERAQRRYRELLAQQVQVTYGEVLEELRVRDELDQNREVSPLRPAEDAIIIQTEDRSPEEVALMLLAYAYAEIP